MNDTPRVTVPVEPEYTATDYLRLIAEGWEVIESTGSQMTIQNPEDDGPQDLVIDVDAMLSAAPAPEGGAVSDAMQRLRVLRDQARNGTAVSDPDEHDADELDAILSVIEPALATREEPPASRLIQTLNEASARVAENPDRAETIRANWTNGEEAPAEAGEDDVRGLIGEAIQGLERAIASTRFDSASKEVFAACVDDFRKVLRAQPPAREDAQPVAWLVGEGGGTVMTRAAAWVAGKRDQGVSVTPLYIRPAPDALRVALEEALRDMRNLYDQLHSLINGDEEREVVWQAMRKIDKTLTALQAEQKGGA